MECLVEDIRLGPEAIACSQMSLNHPPLAGTTSTAWELADERNFGVRVIEPPTDPKELGTSKDSPANADKAKSPIDLIQKMLSTKLGKLTAATLCSLTIGGGISAESAHAEAKPNVSYAIITACSNPSPSAPIKVQEKAMECLLTQEQSAYSDTPPMRLNPILNESAKLKNNDLVRCEISHYACDKSFYYHITQQTDVFNCYGENIAWGSGPAGSMQSRFGALMRSPEHKANITNPDWDFYGVNVLRVDDTNYITTHFASYDRCDEISAPSGSINYTPALDGRVSSGTTGISHSGTSWVMRSSPIH